MNVLLLRCIGSRLALRIISRRRSNSVALGAKRTLAQPRLQSRIYEYTPFCNGPVDVNCSPIVTPPSSRFCPWSAPRPPHYAVRGSGEPI